MALLLLGGSAAAECLYHGVPYSEGARVCMHRTMYMCRGERWVKTAERCWERYFTSVPRTRSAADSSFLLCERRTGYLSVATDVVSVEEDL